MFRRESDLVNGWIVATLAASIVGWIDGRFAAWCALIPSRVLQGEVWRVFTWPFIELGPMSLIFTCVAIYKFGSELASIWGDFRLRRYATHVVGAATIAACLLALVTGHRYLVRVGGWVVGDMLTIAWARQFPERTLVLYGLLELSGKRLIKVTVAVTILFALAYGPVYMGLELGACAAAIYYPTKWLRQRN